MTDLEEAALREDGGAGGASASSLWMRDPADRSASPEETNASHDFRSRLDRVAACIEMLLEADCQSHGAVQGSVVIPLDRLLGPVACLDARQRGKIAMRLDGSGTVLIEKESEHTLSKDEEDSLLERLRARGLRVRIVMAGRYGGDGREGAR